MKKSKKPDPNERVDSNALLPFDQLVSNRGHDEGNMYLDRTARKRKSLNFNDDPGKFNAPPWMNEEGKTMGDERTQLYGSNKQSKEGDATSRGGLSRDDLHSEYGGANMFARMKKRREQQAQGMMHGRRRQKRGGGLKVTLAGRVR
jgi:hypothetical protein